jgi:hypothetical protein
MTLGTGSKQDCFSMFITYMSLDSTVHIMHEQANAKVESEVSGMPTTTPPTHNM